MGAHFQPSGLGTRAAGGSGGGTPHIRKGTPKDSQAQSHHGVPADRQSTGTATHTNTCAWGHRQPHGTCGVHTRAQWALSTLAHTPLHTVSPAHACYTYEPHIHTHKPSHVLTWVHAHTCGHSRQHTRTASWTHTDMHNPLQGCTHAHTHSVSGHVLTHSSEWGEVPHPP